MFSSCIITVDGVLVGDGGVGVFVGVGGIISENSDCTGSVGGSKKCSDEFSEGKCVLDSVIEDSDVGDEELDESSLCVPT